jgi:aromatic-L-amino-acid decarboxylase
MTATTPRTGPGPVPPAPETPAEQSLDPDDWDAYRRLAHQAVDDLVDRMAGRRSQPVWQPMPDDVREAFTGPLPREGVGAETAYREVMERVAPYTMGNDHGRFWGWYMGAGNPVGNLADLVASVLNPNLGGGDHAPVDLERQVVRWCAEAVGYPTDASGLLVGGASEANLVGLAVARSAVLGPRVRTEGIGALGPVSVYASAEVHSCHRKACELLGLGEAALRLVPTTDDLTMDVAALAAAVAADRAAGVTPLAVVATAGTINSGAVDDLGAIADVARREGIWFHVDGAIGGFLGLSGAAHLVRDLHRADSVALDLHKWMQAPIDVGLVLVRDEQAHRDTFSIVPAYLQHATRGLAAGDTWFNEYGIALSRGFRALRVWMALRAHGADAFGRLMDQSTAQARYLAALVDAHPDLERVAPVGCDIVCLRYAPGGVDPTLLDAVNRELVVLVQESGVAVVSESSLGGRLIVRVAIGNHRTVSEDLDLLVSTIERLGPEAVASAGG